MISFLTCSKTRKHGRKMICVPCSNDSEEVEATHFCKTCEDPEPLCEMCAKDHTRYKMTKNHKIYAEMTEFPNNW